MVSRSVGESVGRSVRRSVGRCVGRSVGRSVRLSVRRSVRPSVRPSVGPSVRLWVCGSVSASVGRSVGWQVLGGQPAGGLSAGAMPCHAACVVLCLAGSHLGQHCTHDQSMHHMLASELTLRTCCHLFSQTFYPPWPSMTMAWPSMTMAQNGTKRHDTTWHGTLWQGTVSHACTQAQARMRTHTQARKMHCTVRTHTGVPVAVPVACQG